MHEETDWRRRRRSSLPRVPAIWMELSIEATLYRINLLIKSEVQQ